MKHHPAVQGETCRVRPGFTEPRPGSARDRCRTFSRRDSNIPFLFPFHVILYVTTSLSAQAVSLSFLNFPNLTGAERPCIVIRHYSGNANLASCARCSNHDSRWCIPGPCGWSAPCTQSPYFGLWKGRNARSDYRLSALRDVSVQEQRATIHAQIAVVTSHETSSAGVSKYLAMPIAMHELLFA
jgi:hypothetical protein